jgi:amidase
MQATDLHYLTLAEAARLVRERAVSPVELTRAALERIERLDGRLRSFITVTAATALAEARRAEAAVGLQSALAPLHGVPIALKDLSWPRGYRRRTRPWFRGCANPGR